MTVSRMTKSKPLSLGGAALVMTLAATGVHATEPCDDFGECKALIEINASDGDIGFHFLMDGDDLLAGRITDPNGRQVFQDLAKGPLAEQKLTETFAESAEPLCWEDPDADEEDLEDIVTLEEFLEIWADGTYTFSGRGEEGEKSSGETELTYMLPAAPADVDFDGTQITWADGDDLGNCASYNDLTNLVSEGVLPEHPENVDVDAPPLEPPVGRKVDSARGVKNKFVCFFTLNQSTASVSLLYNEHTHGARLQSDRTNKTR